MRDNNRWNETIGALLGTASALLLAATIVFVLVVPWPIRGPVG